MLSQEDKFPFPLPLMFLLAIFNLLLVSNFRGSKIQVGVYDTVIYSADHLIRQKKKNCNIVLTFIIKLRAKKDVVIMRKIYC